MRLLNSIIIWIMLCQGIAASLFGAEHSIPVHEIHADGKSELSGPWLFFPHEFLSPSNVRNLDLRAAKSRILNVPGDLGEDPTTGHRIRWGTLIVKLRGLDQVYQDLGIRLRGDSAFQIFAMEDAPGANFVEVLKVGKPGKSQAESIPQVADRLGLIKVSSSASIFLVIHISGWHYEKASIWRSPIVGDYATMRREVEIMRISDVFVIGMMSIMLVYSICIYIYQTSDKSSLWLALMGAVFSARLVATSGTLLDFICQNPTLNTYLIIRKLEFGTLSWHALTVVAFVTSTFRVNLLQKLLVYDAIVATGLSGFVWLADGESVGALVTVTNIYILLHFLLGLYILTRATLARKTGAWAMLLGLFLLLATALHDMAIVVGINKGSNFFLSSYGLVALIFCQGQILAIKFNKALILASRLSNSLKTEVELQTAEVKSILADIPQGILCIVPPGVVDLSHSSKLESLLVRPCQGSEPWFSVLFRDAKLEADQISMARDAIESSLGEHLLGFEINAHCLPEKLMLVSPDFPIKHLRLTWSAVSNSKELVEKIIVTLNDITADVVKSTEGERQVKEMKFIQELVGIPLPRFLQFIRSTDVLLRENESLTIDNEERSFAFLRKILINTHTLKGAARTLGLKVFASALHAAEDVYQDCQKGMYSDAAMQRVLDCHQDIVSLFQEYLRINDQVLGRNSLDMSKIQVDRSLLEKSSFYFSYIQKYLRDQFMGFEMSQLSDEFARTVYSDVEDIVASSTMEIGQIAKDLGKPSPKLMVEGSSIFFTEQASRAIKNAFVHILRNSMDHGIESPEERKNKGKPEMGTIEAAVKRVDRNIQIIFRDDGRGLNLLKLKAKAQEQGLLAPDMPVSDTELAELIFNPHLSTASEVTQYSGRGVGMGAVRSFIRELGGDVRLNLDKRRMQQGYCPFEIEIILDLKDTSDFFGGAEIAEKAGGWHREVV